MVGEIDCREGLLVAVERGIYSSIEEGMTETLRVIRSAITHLIQKKKFRVSLSLTPSPNLCPVVRSSSILSVRSWTLRGIL